MSPKVGTPIATKCLHYFDIDLAVESFWNHFLLILCLITEFESVLDFKQIDPIYLLTDTRTSIGKTAVQLSLQRERNQCS